MEQGNSGPARRDDKPLILAGRFFLVPKFHFALMGIFYAASGSGSLGASLGTYFSIRV
jgi:hypothetical protein